LLTHLSIKNYALIDHLNVKFNSGFTIITGETGAGKSILLGGLSLVLGKRADLGSLKDKDLKCVIEAEFRIGNYRLKPFFKTHDLDYDEATIIRREILPSGKSRAFINDTPITLDILTKLGNQLIDVHSQHQTLQLASTDFQMRVIDALAENKELLGNYSRDLFMYRQTTKELADLIQFQQNANKEHDYNSFLLKELEATTLTRGLQEELEAQYEQLSNIESIMEQLSKGNQLLNDDQMGVMNMLSELRQLTSSLAGFGKTYEGLNQRVQSVFLEMDDISNELQNLSENSDANPQQLAAVSERLQVLFDLQKKHGVLNIEELISVRDALAQKVSISENIEADITAKEEALNKIKGQLDKTSNSLRERRRIVLPKLKANLEKNLATLGMPNSSFKLEINAANDFKGNGKDDLTFLFSANRGTEYGDLKKVASGGELSRIMLTIKAILAKFEHLPTMMFDEIDTGVSGEISNRMGDIMHYMSKHMQVFSITHLPQVASKGDQHFKVFKTDDGVMTRTQMKLLNDEERVVELAEMLGGKDVTDSALAHAKQLLN
jgi:DNA repair protein RecN (Recombination protein N)